MAGEPEELVEMRRVLGGQLAALRATAGLNQGQLARATFRDRTSVAHIEKGRSRADERFWKLADDTCQAEGVLLAGFRVWEAARQEHEVRVREELLAEARATAEAMRASLPARPLGEAVQTDEPDATVPTTTADAATSTQRRAEPSMDYRPVGSLAGEVAAEEDEEIVARLIELFCEWVGAMNRRELIQFLGRATGTAVTLPMLGALDTDEQERLARAIASPDRVDQQVIDHLEDMLRYCQRQEDARGSRAVLHTVLAQRHLVSDLLTDCPADLRSCLLSLYSNMSSSIGFYFFELNEFESAWSYHDEARAAAHDAGNIELSIYALCSMSFIASWLGKAHTGIDFAAAAQRLVSKTDDPLLRVCLAERTGTAYAIDGQYEACLAEFENAQAGLELADQVPVESPAYWYNEGLLASGKSGCLLRLGRPQEAMTSASTALALYDKSFVDGFAFCTLDLGNAYLQSGEIDEAARIVGDAAVLAARNRQARLVKELRATHARMRPWRNTQAVKALDEQLAAYGLVPSSAT